MLDNPELSQLRKQVLSLQNELQQVGDGANMEIVAAMLDLPIVLWEIDLDGTIKLSVGRALEALGLSAGQVVGQNAFDLYALSPAASEPIRRGLLGFETFSQVLVEGLVWENRYFPRRKDGKLVGLYCLSMDITRQFEAEQATKHADLKWQILAENMPGTITILDRDHRFVYVNSTDHAHVVEQKIKIYDLIDPSSRETARQAIEACFNGELHCQYEGTAQIEGTTHWFENRLAPMTENGEITSVIIISTDITRRKQTEAAARAMESQSIQAQKLESLGMLAGGIAHDFNNLLVGMMGYTELARLQLAAGQDPMQSLAGVDSAASRAAELCDQMLSYAGKGHFEMRKIDLSQLVEDFSQLLSVSLRKDLRLVRELSPDLWRVEADGAQLQQVVMNVITNAADSMTEGVGNVVIRTGCGHFDAQALSRFPLVQPLAAGDYVFLEVTDTGNGMDPQTLQKMFDPFFTTKPTGRGLGLASTLAIVRGHRGGLSTHSEVGKGTTIRLFLPRASGSPPPASVETTNPDSSALGRGFTILLADDEPNVLNVAKAMLEHLGFEVIPARNGQEAVDLYGQHSEISAVILDVTMPVLNGDEAARSLLEINPNAKIILSSGYHDRQNIPSGIVKLPKPYRIADLRATLTKLLGVDSNSIDT